MVKWSHNIDYKPTIYLGLPQLDFFFTILFSYIVILGHGPWQFTSLIATHYILFFKTHLGVVSNCFSSGLSTAMYSSCTGFLTYSTPWLPLASFGVALEIFFLHFKDGADLLPRQFLLEVERLGCHLWTWKKKRKLRTIRDYRWGVYLLQLLLLLPATSPRLSVTSLASCAPPLPGRCGLGGGITKAGPGRPLQCTSASTPPSWTYQSPPLPPKAPPPPGSSSSSLVSELGQEDPHSAPEASPALWESRLQCHWWTWKSRNESWETSENKIEESTYCC